MLNLTLTATVASAAQPVTAPTAAPAAVTANDRLKRNWNRNLLSATALGVAIHAGVLVLGPEMEVTVPRRGEISQAEIVRMVNIAEELIPPPPGQSAFTMPELPSLAPLAFELELVPSMSPELMLPEFRDFELTGQALVPPAPEGQEEKYLDYRDFAAYVVRPEIRNRSELKRFLERSYQPIYEYSGATGVVQVSFWINEGGTVEKAAIAKSSGSRSLDRLALRLSRVLRFRPAMMAGRPVRILVHVPITFRAA